MSSKWSDSEIHLLINIFKENQVMKALDGSKFRNADIYKTLVPVFESNGFKRTFEQIRSKWKSLQAEYRKASKSNNKSGSGNVTCPFYDDLELILGGRPNQTLIIDGVQSGAQDYYEISDPELMRELGIVDDVTAVLSESTTSEEGSRSSTPSTSGFQQSPSPTASLSSVSQPTKKRKASYAGTLSKISEQIDNALKQTQSSTEGFLTGMREEAERQRKWEELQIEKQRKFQTKLMKSTMAQVVTSVNMMVANSLGLENSDSESDDDL